METLTAQLVHMLAFEDDKQTQLKLVAISGFQGSGKTTLARTLYVKCKRKFQCSAFVRVSRNPDFRSLLTSILSQIKAPSPQGLCDVQGLICSISDHLQGKRYFIVIDDVRSPSVWDIISHAFPGGNFRSRMIVTTQSEQVEAAYSGYKLKSAIFKMGATDDGCTRTSTKEMSKILNIRYNNLPLHLKTCLLYFSMYPEGSTITKDDLAKRWVGEGFIAPLERHRIEEIPEVPQNKTEEISEVSQAETEEISEVPQEKTEETEKVPQNKTEEIAHGYFDDLIARGMIQPVDRNHKGEVLSCTVHHTVLDLIRYKSKEDNFIVVVDNLESTLGHPDIVRRLSVQFGCEKGASIPESIILSQVRSLAFYGFLKCVPSIADYGLLRVLNLHIWSEEDKIFDLTTIGELCHLVHLKIECNITVRLPRKIQRLQHLGTLELHAAVVAIPSDIGHLKKLMHVRCRTEADVRDLGDLTSLLDLQLTCSTVENLEEHMKCLRSIIEKLRSLRYLALVPANPSTMCISCDSLCIVSSAPAHLQRLELPRHCCIFSRLPEWIGELHELCVLKIAVRELSREDIDILKGLPALTTLSLHLPRMAAEMIVFGPGGFSRLTYFKFKCNVPWLKFEADAMPKLEKLKLCLNSLIADEQGTTPIIIIERLSGLQDISAIIGSAGVDAGSAWQKAIRNYPGNPKVQLMGLICYGDQGRGTVTREGSGEDENIEAEIRVHTKTESSRLPVPAHSKEDEPEDRPSISEIISILDKSESTDGHSSSQTSLCQYDGMLGVEPLELRFHLEHNNQISCSVELTNETSNSMGFNIRTPNKQYNTQPEKGIVLPGRKRDVKIIMQPQESTTHVTNADNFVLQSTKVKEGLADEDIVDHMFNNKKVVDNVNLMVVHEPKKHQVDLSLDRQEQELSKGIVSSSNPPESFYFPPLESISGNQGTGLMNDRTVDLATGAIGSLLPKLSELLNKYNLETSIRNNVDCVIQELRLMRADLCDVSEVQRDNNNEFKLWADEVRELSYDIEDVVDGFLIHVEGSEPATITGGLMGLIHKMTSLFTVGRTSHQIGCAINDIKNQVQNKATWKGKYKVQELVANSVSTISAHHLSSLVKDRVKLIGIDDAMKDLTKRLSGADGNGDVYGQELKVHSIFGIGGLGKTTLARAVYNQLKGPFRLTAFVPVGWNPDVKKLFYDILFELDKPRCIQLKAANLDERQLTFELIELLENKRYLIVIDDLWDIKVWHDSLRFAFVDSKCGSKIIITTRIFEVAKIATDVFKLDPLSRGYSEELFYATLSPDEGRREYDVTDEVIEKILSKCRGVPLAIITIASLLASKQREDWPKVYNSIGFGSEVNEDVENTRKILLFSFSDLPRHLRTCLLHLSIFPEDRLINKDTVIWMWVGEGFVPEEPGRGLFEVGERFFNQLVSRSMIQLVVSLFSDTGFRIHDLVLDMICSLSKDENFVTVLEKDEQQTSSKNKARRLAVQKRGTEKQDLPDCMGQLRSFYAIDCRISVMPPLPSFKVLRVLSMEGCRFIGDETYHLEHIGKLLQLRYLGLERLPIEELPEEIGNLLFLQTLILNYNGKIKELPRSICLLRQLKCLRAICCNRLEVPDWIWKMTSLEDLSLKGPKMTRVVAEGLGKLKELRDLDVDFGRSSNDSWNRAFVSSVGNLPKLQSLKITMWFCGDPIWEGFVPPRHLHRLKLRLTVTGSGAFPKLRHLSSAVMLSFQQGVMPQLEYLELQVSLKNNFDSDFTSLWNLPSLQIVQVVLLLDSDSDFTIYAKKMAAALRHAVATHPRRPVLHLQIVPVCIPYNNRIRLSVPAFDSTQ